MVALECLVDYVSIEGTFGDLSFLLDLVEGDPVPYVQHGILRLMVDQPPFPRARHHRNDKEALVERLWKLMNSTFWFDSRLRCDVVDLYHELYGRKRPSCIPLPELAALRPQKVDKEKAAAASKEVNVTRPRKLTSSQ